ncbi:hypothetical protein [Cryptosporangium sp. NPDC051539]|uniref:hypothetical protein n=1 Tax=Cryptosporangium sp. NPDC051539 TaxID=3363962 RepID=UPI0037A73196
MRILALGLAVAAAVAYGAASLLQAVGARRARSALVVWREPAYLAGLGLDAIAWLMSLVALRTLPIYLVQTVLAGSLAVTAVGARMVLGARLRRVDVGAIAVTVAALGLLAATSGTQSGDTFSRPAAFALAAASVVLALAGWAAAAAAARPRPAVAARPRPATAARPGPADGAARPRSAGADGEVTAGAGGAAATCAALAGAGFGGAAIAVRGLRFEGNWPAEPALWALVVFGVAGALLYAVALEHGDVARVTAVLWTVEVIVPSIAGFAWLGDTVRPGWAPAAAAGFALAIGAALVLARSPAQEPTAVPAPPR